MLTAHTANDERSSGHAASSSVTVAKNVQAPPVKQRSAAAPNSGSTLKAKVPPPVPPRGSPRKRDSDAYQQQQQLEGGSSRALSTTPGIQKKTKNIQSLVNKFSKSPHKDTLTVPPHDSPLPRFGEQRSPSNVRDWLELHDLFEASPVPAPPATISPPSPTPLHQIPAPPQSQIEAFKRTRQDSAVSSQVSNKPQIAAIQKLKVQRKDSMISTTSSNYSAARSRASQSRPLNHIDIFQRQNSALISRRSSAASIVYNFPPIPSEHSERSSAPITSYRDARAPRAAKRHEKRMQYLRYADMALADDNDDQFEDNIVQSMHAFVEVKRELENAKRTRKQRVMPVPQEPDPETELKLTRQNLKPVSSSSGDAVPKTHARKVRSANKPEPKMKSKNVPSTISEGFASSYTLNPLTNSRRSSFVEF